MSTCLSKKLTISGSLSSDARTCSNEKDQSAPERSGPASWGLGVSEFLGVRGASSSPSAGLGFKDAGGLLGSCSLRPTSSILKRRLVTWATARYRDSSSGSP
uniref:Uncharacterized protein n=1 Tax=Hippocampus comes TaxID=109280 RepID=A0A3Q2XN50_HIPCM